jgi:hypothetical protein
VRFHPFLLPFIVAGRLAAHAQCGPWFVLVRQPYLEPLGELERGPWLPGFHQASGNLYAPPHDLDSSKVSSSQCAAAKGQETGYFPLSANLAGFS